MVGILFKKLAQFLREYSKLNTSLDPITNTYIQMYDNNYKTTCKFRV